MFLPFQEGRAHCNSSFTWSLKILKFPLPFFQMTYIRLFINKVSCTLLIVLLESIAFIWNYLHYRWRAELSTLPHSAGASRNFIENSGISRNLVSLPPGVIISRICEILPRLDCLPLISWPSARKYIDLTSTGYQSNRDVQDFSVFIHSYGSCYVNTVITYQ